MEQHETAAAPGRRCRFVAQRRRLPWSHGARGGHGGPEDQSGSPPLPRSSTAYPTPVAPPNASPVADTRRAACNHGGAPRRLRRHGACHLKKESDRRRGTIDRRAETRAFTRSPTPAAMSSRADVTHVVCHVTVLSHHSTSEKTGVRGPSTLAVLTHGLPSLRMACARARAVCHRRRTKPLSCDGQEVRRLGRPGLRARQACPHETFSVFHTSGGLAAVGRHQC